MGRPLLCRLDAAARRARAWGRLGAALALVVAGCQSASLSEPEAPPAPEAVAPPGRPEAPPSSYDILRLTENDGLSNTSVISMSQDAKGFMWYGTWNGLNRYDGHTFTVYEHEAEDPTSLPHSWSEALYHEPDGTFWVGTFGGGLARYDPALDGFEAFRHDPGNDASISQDTVTAVLRDRRGALWVGTHRGLNRYDEETDTFVRYHSDATDPTSISNDQIRGLYEDRDGTLWIATGSTTLSETPIGEGGLNRYDPEADAFARYLHDPGDPTSLFHNKVRSMFEDARGTFWVGTAGNVLHRMDREAGTFERLAYDPSRPDRLVDAASVEIPDGCGDPCGTVTFLDEDASGRLWVGLHSVGVLIIDGEGAVQLLDAGPNEATQLGSDLPWSFTVAADGTIWLGALNGGLHRMTRPEGDAYALFEHVRIVPSEGGRGDQNAYFDTMVNDVAVGADGTVWIALKDGIDRYDPEADSLTRVPIRSGDSAALRGPVAQVLAASDGTVWALGYRGVLYRLGADGRPEESVDLGLAGPFSDSFELLFKDASASALTEASDGSLWAGTLGDGLRRYDPASEEVTTLPHASELGAEGDVVDIEAVGDGVYVATAERLVRIEGADAPQMTPHDAPLGPTGDPLALTDLLLDRRGRLVVGTTGGVFVFDPGTGAFASLGTEAGAVIGNASVASLAEGPSGSLWIATYQGTTVLPVNGRVVRHDPTTGATLRLDTGDGLPSIGFREHSAARAPDGTIYFGGVPGLVAVDPSVVDRETPPEAVLTGLEVYGEPVVPGPGAPIRAAIGAADHITFDPDERDFTISFVGIDFRAPEEVRYQHRLAPYDRAWVDDEGNRQARYARVPPGDYTFEVRASNRYGVWSPAPTSIPVTVRPPWWRTWWAYGSYLLLFVGAVVGADRIRRRQVIRRERAQIEKEREAALLREKELLAEAAEARADALQTENKRQMQELEQTRLIEQAYRELEASHEELRRTQDRLVQQEKLASLGQLTAGIAHEIKNPLNFVNNFAELNEELARELRQALDEGDIEEAAAVASDIEQNAAFVQQHGRRADAIVKSMMAHARAGAGQAQPVDLNALVEEHVDLAYHGKKTQRPDFVAAIERGYDDDVGAVMAVPQEVGRVLLNLLSNAFDAVADVDAPSVSVTTRRDGDDVRIRVADSGPGIPEADRQRIFEPFFTTKPTGEGTGLGLSMSYDIVVNGYGGTLAIDGAEGGGAAFEVGLPLPALPEADAASGADSASKAVPAP